MKYVGILVGLGILGGIGFFLFGKHVPAVPASYSLGQIDIAGTPGEQERGLGGRDSVPDDYGMLFVFSNDAHPGFWMKDMRVPLDIIWLKDDGSIAGVLDSVATSTYPSIFYPPVPVRYVLETRAGLARERGWATSTPLALPLP